MLSESFVAASSSSPSLTSANSSLLKDAGIFVHSFQPHFSLNSTLKKSAAAPSCIAISGTHIFAAQSNKAVVHVYSREKGNHESTIHFPTRIHALALLCDDTVLALGGEDGSILLWEICTGRLVVTPRSHLQAVNALARDLQSNFLLSGSLDSKVHVWSLADILSFPSLGGDAYVEEVEPRHVLADHRAAITAIVTGHSVTAADIAVSASKDRMATVWNYRSGQRLRTYLLPSTPLCLALDPADRAVYIGFEDGAVQFLSFYNAGSALDNVEDNDTDIAPIQPPTSTLKYPASSTSDVVIPATGDDPSNNDSASSAADSTLCLALSYDSTTLLSGHVSGKINSWSTAASGSFSTTLTQYHGSPITNLDFLQPQGWVDSQPLPLRTVSITKPAPHEPFSGSKCHLAGSYKFSVQQSSAIGRLTAVRSKLSGTPKHRCIDGNNHHSDFETALTSALFPDDLLAASAFEVANWDSNRSKQNAATSFADNEDFVSIDMEANGDASGKGETGKALNPESREYTAEKIAHLEKQVAHLTGLADANVKHIEELSEQNERYRLEKERAAKHRRKNEVWRSLKRDALRGLSPKAVPEELMDSDGEYDYAFDSGTTDVEADDDDGDINEASPDIKGGDVDKEMHDS